MNNLEKIYTRLVSYLRKILNMERKTTSEKTMTKDLLKITNLTKTFGGITAVDDLSFNVKEGAITGLIGPNGSGKTVTFNLITGIYKPDGGEVYLKGERLIGLKPHEISRKGIGRTFQLIRVFPKMTVLENLEIAAREKDFREEALELLEFVDLSHLKDEYGGNLSYGQQKLLEFVRVLMTEPDLVLLDEPTSGINPTLVNKLMGYIRELNELGKTFLVVEHDMKVVMNLCEKLVVLDFGKKIAEGKPKEIRKSKTVIEAYFGH